MNEEQSEPNNDTPKLDLSIYGTRLLFDDAPLSSELDDYESELTEAGACALEQWKANRNRTAECARAVVGIITRDVSHVGRLDGEKLLEARILETVEQETNSGRESGPLLGRCYAALGALCEARSDVEEALDWFGKSIDVYCSGSSIENFDIWFVLRRTSELLNLIGEARQARRYVRRVKAFEAEAAGAMFAFRGIALEMYQDGDLDEAEALYAKMIEHRYTPASSYCHLVRIKILMNRIAEAEEDVDRAMCEWRDENYVLARILFFRALFAMLAGRDYSWFLQQIKATCESGGATLNWSMKPVLEHLKSRVSQEHFDLLAALHRLLSKGGGTESLMNYPLWADAVKPADEIPKPAKPDEGGNTTIQLNE